MPEVQRFVYIPSERKILGTIVDMGQGYCPAVLGAWKYISQIPNAASW